MAGRFCCCAAMLLSFLPSLFSCAVLIVSAGALRCSERRDFPPHAFERPPRRVIANVRVYRVREVLAHPTTFFTVYPVQSGGSAVLDVHVLQQSCAATSHKVSG